MTNDAATARWDAIAKDVLCHVDDWDEPCEAELAEGFRSTLNLPTFPQARDLRRALADLEVPVWDLPAPPPGLHALNYSTPLETVVHVDTGVPDQSWALAHEIREILERAIERVNPGYKALPTHDNVAMNPRSERFAAALLLSRWPLEERLNELGYDLVAFAREADHSIAAVIRRVKRLYSGPTWLPAIAIWYFEDQCRTAERSVGTSSRWILSETAVGGGIATGRWDAELSPEWRAPKIVRDAAVLSLAQGAPAACSSAGSDIFGSNYLITAEPLYVEGFVRGLYVAAMRDDAFELAAPWFSRLGIIKA